MFDGTLSRTGKCSHKAIGRDGKASITLSKLRRSRWNVVDLVTVQNRGIVPSYYFCDIDMTVANQMRARLNARGKHVTVTAMLVKAISMAQTAYPVSRTFRLPGGKSVLFSHICAGFTVERTVDDQPSVFLGIIHNPHEKSLQSISSELRQYAEEPISEVPQLALEHKFTSFPWLIRQLFLWLAARSPLLRKKYLPATFGLSSLGKLGVRTVIGPCVATCTFGVGELQERPLVINQAVQIRTMLTLSLGVDTRVMSDQQSGAFLNLVKDLLEKRLDELCSDRDPSPTKKERLLLSIEGFRCKASHA